MTQISNKQDVIERQTDRQTDRCVLYSLFNVKMRGEMPDRQTVSEGDMHPAPGADSMDAAHAEMRR